MMTRNAFCNKTIALAATAPGSDVKFALDAQSAQNGLRLRRDTGGLRLAFGGLVIIVK